MRAPLAAVLFAALTQFAAAAASGMPKREIVEARMSGTSREDLWISTSVARRQGADAGVLMTARAAAAETLVGHLGTPRAEPR